MTLIPALMLGLWAMAQIPGRQCCEFNLRPVEWMPGDTLHDPLPAAFVALDAHLRVHVPGQRKLDVSLLYNRRDSLNYRRCRLYRPAGPVDDRLTASPVDMELVSVDNGVETVLSRRRISRGLDPGSDDYSLKLVVRGGEAAVIMGQKGELCRSIVDFNPAGQSELLWLCGSPAAVVRHTLSVEGADEPPTARFADSGELARYLQASTDVNEGYWTYFDRDSDGLRFNISGLYRLATVRSDDGRGYEIIYLGGAPEAASVRWQPLAVKGYLRPTGFIGHYDLEWIDLQGRMHKRELSADISDGALLTLYFPLFDSKVRFRKQLQTD